MRLWVSDFVQEVRYEEDLGACCRREARGSGDGFECLECGARWRAALPVEAEECAFMEHASLVREMVAA